MKCLVLAGGRGERLWPLSRSDFPKQFINIQKNHSIFQETIARNMAYCDEFIIVTGSTCRPIIANQMECFQGVSYRCVFEEEPRKTMAAIALSCRNLQPSEFVFVVAADHLIDTGDCPVLNYRDAIVRARESAREGRIALFGVKAREIESRFGYFTGDGKTFIEKPDAERAGELRGLPLYRNLGMMLFRSGTFFNELKKIRPDIFRQVMAARSVRVPEGVCFSSETLRTIEPVSVEHGLLEHSDQLAGIEVGFPWSDIGTLEDLSGTEIVSEGVGITCDSAGTAIINKAPDQAVVVNGLEDVLVVNTEDAVYISRKGRSHLMKEIIRDNPALESYRGQGKTVYRPWGSYELLAAGETYSVRRVVILPGKTIYEHSHDRRSEHWTLLEGSAKVTVGGELKPFTDRDAVFIPPKTPHQISNTAETPLRMIETDLGEIRNSADMRGNAVPDVTEMDLGLRIDPVIRLASAYKDYLWGGTKLRDIYRKQCDYDVIAESWELSAHPDGNSTVASGRHRGLSFGKYLETVGREALGWKCAPMQSFPLLVKFIDARENLSVQVHPDDEYAIEHEHEYGKNEMWYVIDAEPGAGLYVGFRKDVTPEEVRERIRGNTILEVLNFCPTHPGDVFFIPAGTVHAIGAGNLVCEIQQSSNSTYRLYDYGRLDKFGNPRDLHIEKALDVLDCRQYRPADFSIEEEGGEKRIRCKYFETAILTVRGEKAVHISDDSFRAITCIRGEGSIVTETETQSVRAGESFFIPAANRILTLSGNLTVAVTGV